jgi:hypothetical protein
MRVLRRVFVPREGMEQEGEKDYIMRSYIIGTACEIEARSYY